MINVGTMHVKIVLRLEHGVATCRTEPVRKPAVSQPAHWSEELFNSRRPKTAADSDRIWKELEKEGAL